MLSSETVKVRICVIVAAVSLAVAMFGGAGEDFCGESWLGYEQVDMMQLQLVLLLVELAIKYFIMQHLLKHSRDVVLCSAVWIAKKDMM
ncbi:hypothetical protein RHSIM_Rhsim08G0015800 [Rhododendron simsii]|uniref:Uncharacterized protein n=1 Tax=Rhododendron simsii TaxID=118357 RepID=A0A834GHR3_RHOSS|nr:hypothetical protein RHSIM_Rhsim08G0015800 [Rhododendron simsii]